jgi:hypothetical protein
VLTPIATLVNRESVKYDPFMGLAKSEAELQDRASAYLKAELQKAEVTYAELAKRLKKHGLPDETEDSIKAKLKRGSFPATFLFACLAALRLRGLRLEDL